MTASWPASLPQRFIVSGNNARYGDGRLRTQMDAGPAKVRRRSSFVPKPLSLSFRATDAQLADFDTFVSTTLLGGSLAFTIPSMTGGTWIVRIAAGMPSWSNLAPDVWEVSLDLEILQ